MAHPTRHDVSIILQVPAARKLPVHLCFASSCCGFITSTVYTVCLYSRGFRYPQTPPRPTLNQVFTRAFASYAYNYVLGKGLATHYTPLGPSDSLRPNYFLRSLLDFCRSATLNVVLVTRLVLALHYCSICLVLITFFYHFCWFCFSFFIFMQKIIMNVLLVEVTPQYSIWPRDISTNFLPLFLSFFSLLCTISVRSFRTFCKVPGCYLYHQNQYAE